MRKLKRARNVSYIQNEIVGILLNMTREMSQENDHHEHENVFQRGRSRESSNHQS